jgi:hypothetical protein
LIAGRSIAIFGHPAATPVTNIINTIPLELLDEIFKLHVLSNNDTGVTLLLVSRQWNTLATQTGALWSRILYGNLKKVEPSDQTGCLDEILGQLRSMVHCPNPGSLRRALKRVNGAGFELTICPTSKAISSQPVDLSDFENLFSTRCRILRMLGAEIPISLEPVVQNLRALEEFRFRPLEDEDEVPTLESVLKPLLQNVVKHSNHIKKLSVTEESTIFDEHNNVQLLQNLTTLGVDVEHSPTSVKH